jgi:hypothetical protein
MGLFGQILIGVVAFLGIFFGHGLRLIAAEEVKAGKKYFVYFEKILLVFVLGLTAYIVRDSPAVLFVLFLFLIGLLVFPFAKRIVFVYLMFVIVLALGAGSGLYLVQASLVFLYGLIAGSLLKFNHKAYKL